jgi:hypothetical protein
MAKRYFVWGLIAITIALIPSASIAAPYDNDYYYIPPKQLQPTQGNTGYYDPNLDPNNSVYTDPKDWLRYQQQIQAQQERAYIEQQERIRQQVEQMQQRMQSQVPVQQPQPAYQPPVQQPMNRQYIPQDNDETYRLPGEYSPTRNQMPAYNNPNSGNYDNRNATGTYEHNYYQ